MQRGERLGLPPSAAEGTSPVRRGISSRSLPPRERPEPHWPGTGRLAACQCLPIVLYFPPGIPLPPWQLNLRAPSLAHSILCPSYERYNLGATIPCWNWVTQTTTSPGHSWAGRGWEAPSLPPTGSHSTNTAASSRFCPEETAGRCPPFPSVARNSDETQVQSQQGAQAKWQARFLDSRGQDGRGFSKYCHITHDVPLSVACM